MSTHHLLLPLPPFLATNKNCHSFYIKSTLQLLFFSFCLSLALLPLISIRFLQSCFPLAILSYYRVLVL